MTEAEWLTCVGPDSMLKYLDKATSFRKLRLFAVASCKDFLHQIPDDRCAVALAAAEDFVEGMITPAELATACAGARDVKDEMVAAQDFNRAIIAAAVEVTAGMDLSRLKHWGRSHNRRLCSIIREVFGNPFQKHNCSNAWLAWNDGTVRNIAQAIYDERAFDRMPILADAVEDAGCDNTDILRHCREPSEHMRGCWVVDLLLGKS
jgi:hypothetical protein